MIRKFLLLCGIIASVLYIAMNVFIPMLYEGYSSFSQTVSELSAVDAPTRSLWVSLGLAYGLLMAVFGWGVYISAQGRRPIRIAGILLLIYGIFSLYWPPMHQRHVLAAGGSTISDTLHLAWAGVSVLFMVVSMSFGAAALGKLFRIYTIITILVLATFGILTSISAPSVQANLPTPWAGVWERINIGAFLLWIIVLAIVLWKDNNKQLTY